MYLRLRGYATGASFSRAASLAANDALEKFAEDGGLLLGLGLRL